MGGPGSGRPKAAKAVQEARGSWRARLLADTAEARDGEPEQPVDLTDEGCLFWPEVVRDLEELGTLRVSDGRAIGAYCEAIASWRAALDRVRNRGVKRAEQLAAERVSQAWFATMMQHAIQFGLTPSASARVQVAHKKPKKEGAFKYVGSGAAKTA